MLPVTAGPGRVHREWARSRGVGARPRRAPAAVTGVGALLAVGGGGFAVGRATAPDTGSTTGDQQFPGRGGPMDGRPGDGPRGTPPGQDGTT